MRAGSAAVVLNHTTLWVVGGTNGENNDDSKYTSEFVSLKKYSIQGPKLPFTVYAHCMVKYNEDEIFLIGGFQNDTLSNQVWIFNPKNKTHTKGPNLNHERRFFACGKMKKNNKFILVVVGGQGSSGTSLNSVEILDPKSDKGWIQGPKLPYKLGIIHK